jgi:predicted amidohydrolase YtcJ
MIGDVGQAFRPARSAALKARVHGGPKGLHYIWIYTWVAAFVVIGAAQAPTPADTILVNGHIVTVDERFSIAEAVAISGGRFTAVGTDAAIRKLAGPATTTIDLRGRTVIPGLADNHLHDAGGGPGVDLSRVRTMDELLAAIAARVKGLRPGEVVTTNSDWHEAQLQEHRLPYRRDLDTVSPVNPVVVVRGGHEYILNSAALRKWNITKDTPQLPGGRITRDAQGELTSIRYPGASIEQYRLLEEMQSRRLLTIRVSQLMRVSADSAEKLSTAVAALHVKPDEGDEWLRVGGMKLGVDGGFEGGLMREPYAEPWGEGGTFFGVNTMKPAPYTDVVKALNRLGWRVATHAVGDAAIDQVLAAYEAADAEKPIGGRRWTIEHGFIPQADQFPRMKNLGLVISAQNHLYLAGPSLVKYWGPARAAWTTPMRAYLDQGLVVAGGTDSAVVPYPPLWAIYHFVTRGTISGGVLGADQQISRREALQVATINNAYLTFEEHTKGSIEPGKLADLVVLPEDILTCPEKRIEQMQVAMTMVGGNVVYRRP